MQLNVKMVGAGVAAAVAAGLGYALLHRDEELRFETVLRDGAFSVRRYPQLVVAETVEQGMRESALSRGFMALTDFLSGALGRLPNAVPLLADGDEDGRGWRTRLVIPANIALDALADNDDAVMIRTLPARRLAAMRFSGDAGDNVLARHEIDLRYWMETNGLSPDGPVEHAFYNSPLAPALMKRNEVLIPLAA
jgi:hypothetical protein